MKRNLLRALPWYPAFNDDGGGDPPPPPTPTPTPPPTPPTTFTQDQVNKLLATDRRKHQDQIKQTVTQLEELKKTSQMTEQQKAELEQRIEALNSSLMTTEERAKADLSKKDKELKTLAETLTSERELWKNNYASEVITNQILKSSAAHKVVSAEQMLDLLRPKTRLVEVLDADGKTVKGYEAKAKIKLLNEKGEEVELDLPIEDVLKRMKELPERFGNLFESGLNSGLGGKGSAGAGGTGGNITDIAKRGPEAYRANRAKFGLGRK